MNLLDASSIDTKDLLDLSLIHSNETHLKEALVVNATYKIDVSDRPYLSFKLRDCNGRLVSAKMDDIADVQECMVIANKLIGHVCRLTFSTSSYKSSLFLDIHSIDISDNKDLTESTFVGTVADIDGKLLQVQNRIYGVPNPTYVKLVDIIKANSMLSVLAKRYNENYGYKCGSSIDYLAKAIKIYDILLTEDESNLATLLSTIICYYDTTNKLDMDVVTINNGLYASITKCSLLLRLFNDDISKKETATNAELLMSECSNILIESFTSKRYITKIGIVMDTVQNMVSTEVKISGKLEKTVVGGVVSHEGASIQKMR